MLNSDTHYSINGTIDAQGGELGIGAVGSPIANVSLWSIHRGANKYKITPAFDNLIISMPDVLLVKGYPGINSCTLGHDVSIYNASNVNTLVIESFGGLFIANIAPLNALKLVSQVVPPHWYVVYDSTALSNLVDLQRAYENSNFAQPNIKLTTGVNPISIETTDQDSETLFTVGKVTADPAILRAGIPDTAGPNNSSYVLMLEADLGTRVAASLNPSKVLGVGDVVLNGKKGIIFAYQTPANDTNIEDYAFNKFSAYGSYDMGGTTGTRPANSTLGTPTSPNVRSKWLSFPGIVSASVNTFPSNTGTKSVEALLPGLTILTPGVIVVAEIELFGQCTSAVGYRPVVYIKYKAVLQTDATNTILVQPISSEIYTLPGYILPADFYLQDSGLNDGVFLYTLIAPTTYLGAMNFIGTYKETRMVY